MHRHESRPHIGTHPSPMIAAGLETEAAETRHNIMLLRPQQGAILDADPGSALRAV